MGLTTGASIVVSQLFGAGELKKMRRAISTAFIFLILCAIGLTVLGLFTARNLLLLLKTPPEVIDGATVYLQIIFAGLLFMFSIILLPLFYGPWAIHGRRSTF